MPVGREHELPHVTRPAALVEIDGVGHEGPHVDPPYLLSIFDVPEANRHDPLDALCRQGTNLGRVRASKYKWLFSHPVRYRADVH